MFLLWYLLRATILLAMAYLAYHALLRRGQWLWLNRGVLLASMALVLLLPLVPRQQVVVSATVPLPTPAAAGGLAPTPSNAPLVVTTIQAQPAQPTAILPNLPVPYWQYALPGIYVLGLLIASLYYIFGLLQLSWLSSECERQYRHGVQLYLSPRRMSTLVFGNRIIIGADDWTSDHLPSLIAHEHAHLQQGHRWDLLLANVLCLVLWFHPLAYALRRQVQLNLEFLADAAVLEQGVDRRGYQYVLLQRASRTAYHLAPHFRGLTKYRIAMMNQQPSLRHRALRFASLLGTLMLGVLLMQSCTKDRVLLGLQQVKKEPFSLVITAQTSPGRLAAIRDIMSQAGVSVLYHALVYNEQGEIQSISVTATGPYGSVCGHNPAQRSAFPLVIYRPRDKDYIGVLVAPTVVPEGMTHELWNELSLHGGGVAVDGQIIDLEERPATEISALIQPATEISALIQPSTGKPLRNGESVWPGGLSDYKDIKDLAQLREVFRGDQALLLQHKMFIDEIPLADHPEPAPIFNAMQHGKIKTYLIRPGILAEGSQQVYLLYSPEFLAARQ